MTSLATIESTKFTVSRTGIEFHDELTFAEWNGIGIELVPMAKAIGFVVGDWLNYGEKRYGEKYIEGRIQAASAIGGGAAKMSFGVA